MTWMHQVRRRILWIAVGVGLTTLGVVSVTTMPAWPLVGVAVATLAIAINHLAGRLSEPTCYGCGENLAGQPRGERGTICPHCGSINQWVADAGDVEDLASARRDDHRA
jgi:hypothetical protein